MIRSYASVVKEEKPSNKVFIKPQIEKPYVSNFPDYYHIIDLKDDVTYAKIIIIEQNNKMSWPDYEHDDTITKYYGYYHMNKINDIVTKYDNKITQTNCYHFDKDKRVYTDSQYIQDKETLEEISNIFYNGANNKKVPRQYKFVNLQLTYIDYAD